MFKVLQITILFLCFSFSGNTQPVVGQYFLKGDSLLKICEYKSAIECFNKALNQCESCGDSLEIRIILSKALTQSLSENYSDAYYSLEIALEKSKKLGSKELEVQVYVALAEFFRNKQDDDDESHRYIKLAGAIVRSNDIKEVYKLDYYNRYAAILAQLGGKPDSVIYYSKKAIELSKELNDLDVQASSLNELGFQYEHYRDINDAVFCYREAADIWISLKSNRYAANALCNLTRTRTKLNDNIAAFSDVNEGIDLVDTNKWYSVLVSLYHLKVELLKVQGDYKKVYEAQKKYQMYGSGVLENRWTKDMAQISSELDLKKKEQAIEEERLMSQLIKQELDAERKFRNGILLFLIGASVSVIVISFYVVKFKKSNKKLNSTLSQKELLLKEIHHRVKNNMQSVSSLLDIQSNFITDEKAQEAITASQKRIGSLALAHQNLYRNDVYDSILLKEYIESIGKNVCPKDIQLTISMKEESFDIEKSQALGFVINELILNSISHAWPDYVEKKTIEIMLKQKNGVYDFSYCDNGVSVKDETVFLSSSSFGITMIKSFLSRSFNTSINLVVTNGFCVKFQFQL